MIPSDKRTRQAISDQLRRYPLLSVQDLLKFLYQSAFGCGHMVSSFELATERIKGEYEEMKPRIGEAEPLDGDYVRLPLGILAEGISAETLGYLFCISAQRATEGKSGLLRRLKVAREMAQAGELPFSLTEFEKTVEEWAEAGFPAIGHSPCFRQEYRASYRVIARELIPFLPLFGMLDQRLKKGAVTLAIEGGSAAGKSTLGQLLADRYGGNLFHTDDFFLRPEQRTPERYAEPGGNMDRERFEAEVLIPLRAGAPFSYRKFDCGTMELGERVEVAPQRLNVIEGAYSMHPDLEKYYDFGVFLAIDPSLQKERILKRNGSMAERFFKEWIPLERRYFEELQPRERCDIIIK